MKFFKIPGYLLIRKRYAVMKYLRFLPDRLSLRNPILDKSPFIIGQILSHAPILQSRFILAFASGNISKYFAKRTRDPHL